MVVLEIYPDLPFNPEASTLGPSDGEAPRYGTYRTAIRGLSFYLYGMRPGK